jgi:hypothetical protein
MSHVLITCKLDTNQTVDPIPNRGNNMRSQAVPTHPVVRADEPVPRDIRHLGPALLHVSQDRFPLVPFPGQHQQVDQGIVAVGARGNAGLPEPEIEGSRSLGL